jgi:hypothetical protein
MNNSCRAATSCLAIILLLKSAGAEQTFTESEAQAVKSLDSLIASRTDSGVTPQSLESMLNQAIRETFFDSWSENPAYVFQCCSPDHSVWLVSMTLGRAASRSRTFLELYEHRGGTFRLLAKNSSGLDDCDTHIILLPGKSGRNHFLAWGQTFGANQAISRAVLYDASEGHLAPVWTMKPTLGLRVTVGERTLVMRYRDAQLFYARVQPDAFADTFEPTGTGLRILSHKALPAD